MCQDSKWKLIWMTTMISAALAKISASHCKSFLFRWYLDTERSKDTFKNWYWTLIFHNNLKHRCSFCFWHTYRTPPNANLQFYYIVVIVSFNKNSHFIVEKVKIFKCHQVSVSYFLGFTMSMLSPILPNLWAPYELWPQTAFVTQNANTKRHILYMYQHK